jgi:hypothetical protein
VLAPLVAAENAGSVWETLDAWRLTGTRHPARNHHERLDPGDLDGAAGHAFVARLITARPFLPGVEGIWADEWRRKLHVRNSCSGWTNCARAAGGS